MTIALLFSATFAVVFTLGIQQLNVERRQMWAAAVTSPLIGISNLVLFKVLPGPTSWGEIAGYLLGGSVGIVAGIWAHPRLVELFASASLLQRIANADALGETVRLATELADEMARSDIESFCTFERMGNHTWYDTTSAVEGNSVEFQDGVTKALRYLTLRQRVAIHPLQQHLVRFPR